MMTMVGLKQSLFRNIFHMKMILDTQIYCTFESMQFDIQFGEPFFKFFAGLYFFKNTFEFSILNGKKIQQYSSIVQYSIVQYSTVQYSIVQYSIVQYSIVQYRQNSVLIAQKGINFRACASFVERLLHGIMKKSGIIEQFF